jgi:hypothetical protein
MNFCLVLGNMYTWVAFRNGKFSDTRLLTSVFMGSKWETIITTNDAYVFFTKFRPWRWHNPCFPKSKFACNTSLGGRFISFKVGSLFRLGVALPNFTPNLIIFLFQSCSRLGTSLGAPSPCKQDTSSSFCDKKVCPYLSSKCCRTYIKRKADCQ